MRETLELDERPLPARPPPGARPGLLHQDRVRGHSGQLGAQNALLGGGRYNNLIQELGGPDMAGIGFAAGMERIILHLEHPEGSGSAKNPFRGLPGAAMAGPRRSRWPQVLREEGYPVYLDYQGKNLKKQFKKADRVAAAFTLILAEDEIRSGSVSIKNMSTQEQIKIPSRT